MFLTVVKTLPVVEEGYWSISAGSSPVIEVIQYTFSV